MDREARIGFIDRSDATMSITAQAALLGVSRSSLYYAPIVSDMDKAAMDALDMIYTDCPFYGSRRMKWELERTYGLCLCRDHIRRLMRVMGIEALYPKKNTSQPNSASPVYPYILRNIPIVRPNQVWGTDITYIRLKHGFCYLVAFIDWYSRYVIAWELSPTLEIDFCLRAQAKALIIATPEISNSDQGSHFTSEQFLNPFKERNVQISMDGRGRCLDNIFTERLWRTVKYEDVYLHDYETMKDVRTGLHTYFTFYNTNRIHQSLNYQTPATVYFQKQTTN